MRSELELDAEVRRLRRSMRRILGALTLALIVGVTVVVAVVGASLTAADKQALQAFMGGSHKADASKTEPAKAATANAVKDQPPAPVRETTRQAPAAPQPPTATATAPPQPAPAQTVVTRSQPAAATTAAALQPPAAEPKIEPQTPQPPHQKQIARARPTDDAAPDANGNTVDRPRERGSNGRYVRVRPADQDRGRAPDDGSDRDHVVIIDRGPGYAPPREAREADSYDGPHEVRRDNGPFGLFGTLFGQHPDRGD